MQIRNVSPLGALECPLIGQVVDAGETAEVDDAHGAILLRQFDTWAPADDAAQEAYAAAVDEQGASIVDDAEAEGMPPKNGSLAAWRAWAAHRGDAEAGSKTRAELIQEHGPDAVIDDNTTEA